MKTKNYSKMEESLLPSGLLSRSMIQCHLLNTNIKRLLTLIAVISLTSFFSAKADLVKDKILADYDFTSITTSPFTLTTANLSGNNTVVPAIVPVTGADGGYIRFSGSGSGGRGTKITNMTENTPREDTVYYEFDWNPFRLLAKEDSDGTTGTEPASYSVCIVRGSNDSIVFGLWYERWSHKTGSIYNTIDGTEPLGDIHLMNISTDEFNPIPAKIVTRVVNGTETSYYTNTLLPFAMVDPSSASYYAVKCDSINKSTNLGPTFKMYSWYRVKAVIDFKNKNIISFEISERDVATENKKSFTNIPFVNTGATNVSRLEIAGTRGKAEGGTGNGINTDFQQRIDNISIYTMHQVAAAADVTIKYKDENGVDIKTPRVVKDQEIGTVYTSIAADKVTILFNDEYYLFDESTIDNVIVATGGSEIIIKFIKATPKNTVVEISAPTTSELYKNVNLSILAKSISEDPIAQGKINIFINGNLKNSITPDVLGMVSITLPNLLVGTTNISAVYIGDKIAYNTSDTVKLSIDITPSTSNIKPYPVYFDLCDQPEIVKFNRDSVTTETTRGYSHAFDTIAGIVVSDTINTALKITYNALGTAYDKIDNAYNRADHISIPLGANRSDFVRFTTPWLNEGAYNVYLSHRISSGGAIFIQSVSMDDQELYFPEGEMVDRVLNSYNYNSNHRRRWNAAAHSNNMAMNYLGSVRLDKSSTHTLKLTVDKNTGSVIPMDMLQFIPIDQDSVVINEAASVSFAKTYYPMFNWTGFAYMPGYDAATVATTYNDYTNFAIAHQVTDQTNMGATYEAVIDSVGIITKNIKGEDFVANYVTVYKAEDKWTRVAQGYSDESFNFTCNLPKGNYYYEAIAYTDIFDGAADYRTFINSGTFTVGEPNAVVNPTNSNIKAFAKNRVLTVKGQNIGSKIMIVDLTGRIVSSAISTSNVFTTTLPQGAYIVKVVGKDTMTTKVLVK